MLSKAQKEARNKWDKENMKLIGCKIKRSDAEAFAHYAKENGTTVNALLRDFINNCLGKEE